MYICKIVVCIAELYRQATKQAINFRFICRQRFKRINVVATIPERVCYN